MPVVLVLRKNALAGDGAHRWRKRSVLFTPLQDLASNALEGPIPDNWGLPDSLQELWWVGLGRLSSAWSWGHRVSLGLR